MLSRISLLTLLVAALAPPALGGDPGDAAPVKADIPFIRCQVCELLAKNAIKQMRQASREATPSNPVTEEKVIERVERMADHLKPEGEWTAKTDLVEEGEQLVVKEMAEVGVCTDECKTIERAAQDILDDHDTDIAEALFLGRKKRSEFTNWLCYELTDSCRRKPPPLPKDRAPGPEFKKVGEEQLHYERLKAEGSTAIPRPFKDDVSTEDLDEDEMTPQQKAEAAVRRLEAVNRRGAEHDPAHPVNKVDFQQPGRMLKFKPQEGSPERKERGNKKKGKSKKGKGKKKGKKGKGKGKEGATSSEGAGATAEL